MATLDDAVLLRGIGRRLPGWVLKNNSANVPPMSPIGSGDPEVSLELVPYGCARLRIAEFPVLGTRM